MRQQNNTSDRKSSQVQETIQQKIREEINDGSLTDETLELMGAELWVQSAGKARRRAEGPPREDPSEPRFTNRGHQNHRSQSKPSGKHEFNPIPQSYGGIDTLYLRAHVDWNSDQFQRYMGRFDLERNKAKAEGKNYTFDMQTPFGIRPATIQQTGTASGATGITYVIKVDGFRFLFATHPNFEPTRPNILIQVDSAPLTEFGHDYVLDRIDEWLKFLGCDVRWLRVQRMDLCVNVYGFSMDQVLDHHDPRNPENHRIAAWAGSRVTYGRAQDGQTLEYGTRGATKGSGIFMRTYDKKAEVMGKADGEKIENMLRYVWGGKIPEFCVRTEFELTRKFLDQIDCKDIRQLRHILGDIFAYLTERWIRMLEKPKDKGGNQKRVRNSKFWDEVRRAAVAAFGPKRQEITRERKVGNSSSKRLYAQIKGSAAKLLAMQGDMERSGQAIQERIIDLFRPIMQEMWNKAVEYRKEIASGIMNSEQEEYPVIRLKDLDSMAGFW